MVTDKDAARTADTADLAAVLAGLQPFDALDAASLSQAAGAARVQDFAAGELIVDAFTDLPADIYVVLEGAADIWDDPDRINEAAQDRFEAGSVIGFSAMLTEQPIGPRVVAAGATRVALIPASYVEPAFYSRSGARFLAEHIERTRRVTAGPPSYSTVEDLVVSQPLVVTAETPVVEIARLMNDRDLPCAVVDTADGHFGIVSDALLRSRVVAEDLPVDTPAVTVMEHPAPTTPLNNSAAEALIDLLESAREYLVVTDRAGALRGVVAARDFVVSPTTAGVSLHEQIRRAETVTELTRCARSAPSMLIDILNRGLASDRVITVYSALVDAIVRSAIRLVFAGHPELSVGAFTWLSLGSNGRREAVPASDVDAAVAFGDALSEPEMARYREVFVEVNDVLTLSGLSIDAHGACSSKAPFSRTNAQWRAAATRWLANPRPNKGAIMVSLLVDARPIHGDPGLPQVAKVFGDFRRHERTMELLLAESLSHRAKARSMRDVLMGKSATFNLKTYGLLPVINIARWAALGTGSTELQTVRRLRAAAGSEILPTHQAERLIEVFDVLQRLRLRYQLEQHARAQVPTDVIERDRISPIERRIIAQAVREITAIQRRMDRVAQFATSDSWTIRR